MRRKLTAILRTSLVLVVALAAPALGQPRRPLLKLDSSFAFPERCDSTTCAPPYRIDITAFLFRDGAVHQVSSGASTATRFVSEIADGQLSDAEYEALLRTLLGNGIRRQGDCEMGGGAEPTGEEVWSWYSWSTGAYNRFRMVFALAGSSGLPQCPESVQRIRAAVYASLP
jgi:hypothetical protein